MSKIIITIQQDTETQEQITGIDGKVTLETFMSLTATSILGMLHQTLDQAKAEEKADLKEYLFDQSNELFSSILNAFAPEIELRPDITEEAILRAELEIHKENKTKLEVIK